MLNRIWQNKLVESVFYNQHRRIITRMQQLDYPANSKGVCYGIAHMATQAILAEDLKNFNDRLKIIDQYSPAELAIKIKEERKKQTILINKARSEISNTFEIKKEFKAGDLKEDKKNNENKEELKKTVLPKLKRIQDMLTPEEKHLLEIPAFFDGVQLISASHQYFELFDEKTITFQDSEKSFPFVLSKKLVEEGGIKEIMSFSGVYSIYNELELFFSLLLNELKSEPEYKLPFSIVIKNSIHAVTVSYDFEKKNWIFIDSNQLPVQFLQTTDELCKKIAKGFFCIKMTVFSSAFFSKTIHSELLKSKLENLKDRYHWQEIHTVTAIKAKFRDFFGVSWLECAVRQRQINIINELLCTQSCADVTDALYIAAQEGNYKIVDILSKCISESKIPDKKTEFHNIVVAAAGGHVDLVNTFLKQEVEYKHLNTALTNACIFKHTLIVKALLEKNADPNYAVLGSRTPLMIACINKHYEIVELLLKYEASPNKQNSDGFTALMFTCYLGNIEILNLLLKYHASLTQVDNDGTTAFHLACDGKKINIVNALLKEGVNPDAANKHGMTGIVTSSINNSPEILKTLIEHKASVNKPFEVITSILMEHATDKERHGAVQKLLSKNYKINFPEYISGFTALHMAAFYGNASIVQCLIANNADVRRRSENDISILEMAQVMKHREISTILEMQFYVEILAHADSYRRDAIKKFLQISKDSKLQDKLETIISDFKEMDEFAEKLQNISSEYKTDNQQRIKSLNEINQAIAKAYQDYIGNKSPEDITRELKETVIEIALSITKNHQKNSMLFTLYGKKSTLATKILDIAQPQLNRFKLF